MRPERVGVRGIGGSDPEMPGGTQWFFRNAAAPDLSTNTDKLMSLVRGVSFSTAEENTVTGPTSPIQLAATAGGSKVDWWTPPLVRITISGTITINLRALETGMNANASLNMNIARCNNSGGFISDISEDATSRTELGTADAALNYTVTPTSTTLVDGDRVRFRVRMDDASAVNMGSGFTVSMSYDGFAASTGDSYVTFTETLVELPPPQKRIQPVYLRKNR